MSKLFIILGVLFLIIGLTVGLLQKFGIKKLPGDILIKNDNFIFYFPVTTLIILSILITVILNIFKK